MCVASLQHPMVLGSSGKNCDTCLPDFYFYYVNAFSRPITHGDAWLGKLEREVQRGLRLPLHVDAFQLLSVPIHTGLPYTGIRIG